MEGQDMDGQQMMDGMDGGMDMDGMDEEQIQQ